MGNLLLLSENAGEYDQGMRYADSVNKTTKNVSSLLLWFNASSL